MRHAIGFHSSTELLDLIKSTSLGMIFKWSENYQGQLLLSQFMMTCTGLAVLHVDSGNCLTQLKPVYIVQLFIRHNVLGN